MHTSILSGKDYMAKVRDGNPTNFHDMFCMTLDLFCHLMDELKQHGYLKEGKGLCGRVGGYCHILVHCQP